ncbi:SpaH/EbpB family LPXTG-anchored major pilin [Halalkalibacillus halophilus]|uniref:SpaH/EbpB family LPXTG-anchored major pilin n=1 Tax=Halalkalibacillus halophilus TaxID=392827 RepID=UPI00041DC666|nr:SpaH/EbpB family LPXTG-anchored major pilin [Halalkalibacillus halophilus]
MKKTWVHLTAIAVLIFTLLVPFGAVTATQVDDSPIVRETGSLTIHKYEREPGAFNGGGGDPTGSSGDSIPGDAEAIEGVEFEITQTHSFNPNTNEWEELSEPIVLDSVTTNSYGEAKFNNLPLGRYTVDEIDGPDHVNLNPNSYAVDIPMTNEAGTELNYDVHIFPKNEVIRQDAHLKKVDENGDPMQGVKFKLFGDGYLDTFTTNEHGKIHVENLAYGDYYFVEKQAAEGYVGTGDYKHEFKVVSEGIKVNGELVNVIQIQNFPQPEVEKTVNGGSDLQINRNETFTYEIKVDLPADIANYDSFVVTDDVDGRLVVDESSVNASVTPLGSSTFENNKFTWNFNPADLTGDGQLTISFDVKLADDAALTESEEGITNVADVDFTNEYGASGTVQSTTTNVVPTYGNLKVIKQDADTKERLDGAIFKVMQGETEIDIETTDENGEILWSELPFGSYQLVEVEAPDGYRLSAQPINFEIKDNGATVKIKVDNTKSDFDLPETGGIGTSLFTMIGLALMALAVTLYLRRRNQIVS